LLCKEYTKFKADNPRPTETEGVAHRIALLFPEHSSKMKFIWLACNKSVDDYGHFYHEDANVSAAFATPGDDNPSTELHTLDGSTWGPAFDLDYSVHLWCRSGYMGDDSAWNQAVLQVFKTLNQGFEGCWKGPLVFTSQMPIGYNNYMKKMVESAHQDFRLDDFRVVFGFLKGNNGIKRMDEARAELKDDAPNPPTPPEEIKYKFVRIAHLSLPKFRGGEKFGAVRIPATSLAITSFQSLESEIAKHIGLPLNIYHIPGEKSEIFIPDVGPFFDLPRVGIADPYYLLLNANAKNESSWAKLHPESQAVSNKGTLLVVREDRKQITPHQVEALVHFCRHEVFPAMKEAEDEHERNEFIKTWLCQANFEEFLNTFKKQKVAQGDESWRDVFLPYDI